MLRETLRVLEKDLAREIFTAAKTLNVQQTHDSKRKYRSVEDAAHFKAEEVCLYTLFYILPVLCNVDGIPNTIIKLWSDFSELVQLLCKSQYTVDNFSHIKKLCTTVPDDMETEFTNKNITFKVHLMRHVPQCIEYIGPVKLHWCFSIENLLSFVRAMVHGRLQMDHALVESIKHYSLLEALESFNDKHTTDPSTLLSRKVSTRNRTICKVDEYIEKAEMVGKLVESHVLLDELVQFFMKKRDVDNIDEISVYRRAQVNDVIYHSKLYSRAAVRQSMYVEIWFPMVSNARPLPGISKHSFIGQILGFICHDQIGYAIVQVFENIGIHAQGKFRMISQKLLEQKYIVQLSQIRRKCLIVTPTRLMKYAIDNGRANSHLQNATKTKAYSVAHYA
jgi:hypothetical protein